MGWDICTQNIVELESLGTEYMSTWWDLPGPLLGFLVASLTKVKPLTVYITTNCGKFSKRWGYEINLPYLSPENLYVGQKAMVRTRHGKIDWIQIGKVVYQSQILSPCLFNLNAEYVMWNARLEDSQAGIKIARKIINNFRHADDTTLMAESEEELKSLLVKLKKS